MRTNETLDFRWRQVWAAEGRLVPELLQLSMTECGPELLGVALEEFFIWDGVPEDYEQTEECSSFFIPWFVYEFVADPHDPESVANAPDESLASLYLRRFGDSLSAIERAFLSVASTSPLSFHVVMTTVPGREIGLRDVLTGDEVVVKERSASTTVQPGALLFTRIVTVVGQVAQSDRIRDAQPAPKELAGRQGIFRICLRLLAAVPRFLPTVSDSAAQLVSVLAAVRDGSSLVAAVSKAMSLAMSLTHRVFDISRVPVLNR